MPISPGAVGATVGESQGGSSGGAPAISTNAPTSSVRTDSPAARLAADYQARGAQAAFDNRGRSVTGTNFTSTLFGAGGGNYDFNYRVFPDDLGADHNSHYMIININVQAKGDSQRRSSIPPGYQNFGPTTFNVTNELSQVEQNIKKNLSNGISGTGIPFVGRGTRRIKEAIALYMPIPTIYTHTNVYEEISLTAFGAQGAKLLATAAGKFLTGAFSQTVAGALSRNVGGRIFNTAMQYARQGAAIAGYPINPKIEVLFSHTPQRSFRMEILMAPRNENESITVKNIIDTMRYHATPELDNVGYVFPTFVPPAEFDIRFYHKGVENTKIPRINTCVLDQIEIDYAPTGIYSTFSNGYPVATRMGLAFREVEILHKQRVAEGY